MSAPATPFANGTGRRPAVEFATNVPVEVTLAYPTPKPVAGQFGDRCMFTLIDGRVMFVDPPVAERIAAAGIGAGEPFTITKLEKRMGTRKFLEWRVEPAVQEPEPEPESPLEQKLRQSLAARGVVEEVPSFAKASTSAKATADKSAGKPASAPAEVVIPATQSSALADALRAAIDAASAAEQYAKERSFSLRFSSEDVRAFALTMLIGTQRGYRQ